MLVKDIMTENPVCCTSDTNLQDVAKMMLDNDCGAVPVVESNNHKRPIGVVTDRDITIRTVAKGDNPLNMTAKSVMTKNVVTATPDMSVEDCVDLMEKHQVRRIPVVDENGNCVGMVAQADIAVRANESDAEDLVEEVSKASASQ
ncbi:MAG: CBS domain-containing protein [Pyrinomonadaceae bacterium]